MVFIDDLAFQLFAISFAGLLLVYTVLSIYLGCRKKGTYTPDRLKSAILPIAVLGSYMLISGLWGQFAWPLPGAYNILFYDVLLSFGIMLISFALAVKYDARLEYVGLLGFFLGIMVIFYGISGYNLGLTKSPLALLGMYSLYGLAGIFSFPVLLIADRLPGPKKKIRRSWYLIFIIFCILLLLASLLAGYIGIAAIPAHLASPP